MTGRFPLWLLAATVATSLLVQEVYPFSHFPMYSRFYPRTWYVYASDAEGEPLASLDSFGLSTPKLKKIYRARLAELRGEDASSEFAEEAAGRKVLEMLAERFRGSADGLELWRVEIERHDDEIVRRARRVAALR